MIHRALMVILACGAIASPALAQTTDPNAVPPQFVEGHNAATAHALYGQTVPIPVSPPNRTRDVTVTGHRRRCAKGDGACIDAVSTELWQKYPDQIRSLCTATEIGAIREGFIEAELGMHGVRNDHLTPATQRLCQFGAKLKKEEVAARSAPPPADADPDALPHP